MPYFRWVGIDLTGKMCTGYQFSKSESALDADLLERGFGLVQTEAGIGRFNKAKIRLQHQIDFFQQLGVLLSSGIHVTQALSVLMQQCDNIRFKEIIFDTLCDIESGASLSVALAKYPIFSAACVHMISAGQDAGVLAYSLQQYADYIGTVELMRKKMRAAALGPAITGVVFLLVISLLFAFIIPAFEHMMQAGSYPISPATRALFSVSHALRSGALVWLAGALLLMWLVVRIFHQTKRGRQSFDWLWLQIPGVQQFVVYRSGIYFLKTLAVLVQGGVPIDHALAIAVQTVNNFYIRRALDTVAQKVNAGRDLGVALQCYASWLFTPDVRALIMVGQETSTFGMMLDKSADLSQKKLERLIGIMTSIFQPVLLIILGSFIAGLILMVYIPLFSLSEVIKF